MSIIGHGVDLVGVGRIESTYERYGDRFLQRCFTKAEADYTMGRKRWGESLAARFAAKEAVLKALGTGWTRGIGWTDIEVTIDRAGRPGVQLHNRASEIARQQGVRRWHLSLSHTEGFAFASAIAES